MSPGTTARERRTGGPAAMALIIGPASLVGLYWMLEGNIWGIIPFLRSSAEIAIGYSDAMAWPGPLWMAIAVLVNWLTLLICVALFTDEIRRLAWGMPPLVIVSFMCFKSAMVRQDAHALPFPFLIAMAALLIVARAPSPRNRIVVGAFAVASFGLGITTIWQLWPERLPSDLDRLTGRAVLRNLDGFWHWKTTVATLEAISQQALMPDQLPAEFRPYLAGKSVSAYPWETAAIRANHLRWQPLPVFQALDVYTPALDLLNAQKLGDASGPEEILLAWEAIDGRQPFYETPGSWQALLNWYDLQLTSERLFVLHRRSTPRFGAKVSVGSDVVTRWDQSIALPPVGRDELLVMEADVEESLRGALKRILLRSTAVNVRVTLRSGITESRRVVRTNMKNGVIVSEWPRGLADLAPMLQGGGAFSPDRVVSISFSTEAPSEFNPAIRIHWFRLPLRQPGR